MTNIQIRIQTKTSFSIHRDTPDIPYSRHNSNHITTTPYNDRSHSDSLQAIRNTLEEDAQNLKLIHTAKMIWAGDFNRHHPLWDEECNTHLFTTHDLDAAQTLIDLLADYSMTMILPKNIPTLQATHTKNLTHPDNIFCHNGICDLIIQCRTLPNLQPPCTDHFPSAIAVDIPMAQSPDLPRLNWQQVNWSNFHKHLTLLLNGLPTPAEIQSLEEFNDKLTSLTTVINTVIAAIVPCTKPSHSPRDGGPRSSFKHAQG